MIGGLFAALRLVEQRTIVERDQRIAAQHQRPGTRPETLKAFSSASASARSRGEMPSASSDSFAVASSTCAAPLHAAPRRR
jgi:hypothetical protein